MVKSEAKLSSNPYSEASRFNSYGDVLTDAYGTSNSRPNMLAYMYMNV